MPYELKEEREGRMITNPKMTLEEKYNDVCEALNSISVELEVYKKACNVYKEALFSMAEDFANAEYILDDLLNKHTQRSKAELVHEYVCKAREEA